MNRIFAAALVCMSLIANPADAKPLEVELDGFPLPPTGEEYIDLEIECLTRIEAAKMLGMFDQRATKLLATPVITGAALGYELNEAGGYDYTFYCWHKSKVKRTFK